MIHFSLQNIAKAFLLLAAYLLQREISGRKEFKIQSFRPTYVSSVYVLQRAMPPTMKAYFCDIETIKSLCVETTSSKVATQS